MLSTNLKDWSEAHVFYNTWNSFNTDKDNLTQDLEMRWKDFVLKKTPNGKLFLNNKMFDQLREEEIYLAHLTPNLHDILQENLIYPSSGCLVGSIYCTPVTETKKGLRLHNLGSYIYNQEVPNIAKIKPEILLIKVKLQEQNKNRLIGIDYLRLGNIHFDLFKELEYLLSAEERHKIENICITKTQEILPLMLLVQNKVRGKNVDANAFFEQFYAQINNVPILAYVLFEVFCEYIALYQETKESNIWKEEGEIYTWYFKNGVFSFDGDSFFNLKSFQPRLADMYAYIKKMKCIPNANYNKMEQYYFDRIAFLLYVRLFNHNHVVDDWRNIVLSLDNLSNHFKPLLGHIIYRELRSFGRYPNFYYYFDQLKALEIWNYWNHNNIAIPFNGIIPKGEVGINPALPDLDFEVYNTEIKQVGKDVIYLKQKKKIDLSYLPRLVDLKFTTLRNKNHEKQEACFKGNIGF